MKIKKLPKIFILILAISFIHLGLVHAQGSNKINIVSPTDNSELNGIYDIKWYSLSVEEIKSTKLVIYEGRCESKGSYRGDIYVKESGFQQVKNEFLFRWNTAEPLLNAASLDDGSYCLSALALSGPDSSTNVNDEINISINKSKNRSPFILNSVVVLFVEPSAKFALDIDASDLDGDKLEYVLDKGPTFLKIDPTTGVLTSEGLLEEGIHSIVVKVNDTQGGADTLIFTLNVTRNAENYKNSLVLENPNQLTIFNSNEALLTWRWVGDSRDVTIQYSSDGSNWNEVEKVTKDNANYVWNVSDIADGQYYIRLIALENSATLFGINSPEFIIAKSESNISVNVPVLVEINPAKNSRVETQVNTISGKFLIPDGRTLNSLEIRVNDSIVLNNCTIEDTNFNCNLTSPLTSGNNKFVVTLRDSAGGEITEEVTFTIVAASQPGQNFQLSFNPLICLIPIILIGLIIFVMRILPKLISKIPKPNLKKTKTKETVSLKQKSADPDVFAQDSIDFSSYDIGSQTLGDEKKSDNKQTQPQTTNEILTQEIEEPALPSSYTDNEEIPAWLKDIDSSDPVGITSEELKANKPLEGAEPHGSEYKDKN